MVSGKTEKLAARVILEVGMVAYTCNPSTRETEAEAEAGKL